MPSQGLHHTGSCTHMMPLPHMSSLSPTWRLAQDQHPDALQRPALVRGEVLLHIYPMAAPWHCPQDERGPNGATLLGSVTTSTLDQMGKVRQG